MHVAYDTAVYPGLLYLVNTMVGVTARLVSVAVKDHDLDDHVTEGRG